MSYDGASRTTYGYDSSGNLLSRVHALGQPAPVAGQFSGLVQGNPPAVNNTGTILLTVSASGQFSGKVVLGGKGYSFKGQFDENGAATVTPDGAPFGLTLQLDLLDDSKRITGTFTGGVNATFVAPRIIFGKNDPAPANLVGRFTALFNPASTAAGIPQGVGFATVTINSAGALRVAGRLADGTKLSQGTALSGEGEWPLFVLLYKKKGFVSGEITFQPLTNTDFAGDVTWLKPATKGPVHSGAFTTTVDLIGSHYSAPPKGQPVLAVANTAPNARVTTTAGNVDPPIDKTVTLTTANKIEVTTPEADKLKLSIKTKTGIFKGSFSDDGKTRKFNGVIFQKQNRGAGFFPGTSESGRIDLAPTP